MEVSTGFSWPTVLIPSAAGKTTVAKRTAPGYMNVSFYNFGTDKKLTYVDWVNDKVEAKIGVYSG